MKKSILIASLFILGMSSSFESKSQNYDLIIDAITTWFVDCVNGGEGAGGCSISVAVGVGASGWGFGGNASVSVTHSVSNCKDGYYACCNLLGAECREES